MNLCRLCGENKNRSRESHSCQAYKDDLYNAFEVDVNNDCDEVHPPKFCDSCYARNLRALMDNRPYIHSLTIFEWNEHSQFSCITCEKHVTMKKGGIPKKKNTARGRPKKTVYMISCST